MLFKDFMFILHCELKAFVQADYDIFTEVTAFKSKVDKKNVLITSKEYTKVSIYIIHFVY